MKASLVISVVILISSLTHSQLEYTDAVTLGKALEGRREI